MCIFKLSKSKIRSFGYVLGVKLYLVLKLMNRNHNSIAIETKYYISKLKNI